MTRAGSTRIVGLRSPWPWVSLACCLVAAWAARAAAQETWPQWGGCDRNFKSAASGLADQWPKEGPKKLWSRPLGDGYSAIVCDGSRLYTLYSQRDEKDQTKGQEAVVALDPDTGKTVWEHRYDAPWPKGLDMEFGPGPHSTPVVVKDRLIAIGVTGHMHCLSTKDGNVLWSHDLAEEFKASLLGRGFAASPIVYQDTVIVPIGGESKSIIAFKTSDGSVAWKNQSFGASSSSPLLIESHGKPQLVVLMAKEAAGLDPADGNLLWSIEHPTMYGANISTPLWAGDDVVFISSAYGMGARAIQLGEDDGKPTAKELWFNPKMKIHHGNAVCVGNLIYGSSGDFGPTFLAGLDVKTGKFKFRKRGIPKANYVFADGKLILIDEEGVLMLAKPTRKGLKIVSKAQMLRRVAWTAPTLVGHRLYLRDRKEVVALDLG